MKIKVVTCIYSIVNGLLFGTYGLFQKCILGLAKMPPDTGIIIRHSVLYSLFGILMINYTYILKPAYKT